MKSGDPFETEALDARRAEQRRRLRCIEDRFVKYAAERLGLNVAPTVSEDDRPIVEEALRDLADREAEHVRETLDRMEARTVASAGYKVLNHADVGMEAQDLLAEMSSRMESIAVDSEIGARVATLVVLLAFADAIAADDYCDPRVKAVTGS